MIIYFFLSLTTVNNNHVTHYNTGLFKTLKQCGKKAEELNKQKPFHEGINHISCQEIMIFKK